ncbi:MAG: phospholipid-binding protein MlaC [Hyphomicrobiales bacterium]
MKPFLFFLALSSLFFAPGPSQAQTRETEELVKKIATEMTMIVRNDPALQTGNAPQLSAVAEQNLGPFFDFERITRAAAGRNWSKASSDQKQELIGQFSKLLIRTYASAIANLKDLDVRVKASRVNTPDVDVTVKTEMIGRPQPVAIDYSLGKVGKDWKFYDVTVEGVSLISAYRDEFTTIIGTSGVTGLIEQLKAKNAK